MSVHPRDRHPNDRAAAIEEAWLYPLRTRPPESRDDPKEATLYDRLVAEARSAAGNTDNERRQP